MKIQIVTALMPEAGPLIARYRLVPVAKARGFAVFSNETINLVVSGIGSTAAAAATGFLAGLDITGNCGRSDLWLNIGIAGHGDVPVGEVFLAHKVTDAQSGRSYYPPLLLQPMPLATQPLITVNNPETAFDQPALYDMEAYGFVQAATRFAMLEQCHCIKVISDNREQPASQLDRSAISALIERHIPVIDQVIMGYRKLMSVVEKVYQTPPGMEYLLARKHFTQTQKAQLASLLQQWTNLGLPVIDSLPELTQAGSAKAILELLRSRIQSMPVTY